MVFPFFERLKTIRAFVLNFEGVLTNDNLLLLNNGEQLHTVNHKDSKSIGFALQKRYKMAVLMESPSNGIEQWLNALGVRDIFYQTASKQASYETFAIENGFNLTETLYMGSDVDDLSSMAIAGISVCPADAVPEVKKIANYICENNGGAGCVREIIRIVMMAHNQWEWS